ncbi:hypothetical protein EVAR_27076_1 [Eumeta japonica]|uniref:Uncharacterized protein n=1 Tax=Eumeta variegata TaxID=151549 RepID=A0A4C1VLE4_EUMVA|nr:hypothetical protein EVAR_27076_1 [Eumeta japonica]
MLWLGWSTNEPPRPVRYHTLTEYRCRVIASAVLFRPASESSGDPFILHNPTLPSSPHFHFYHLTVPPSIQSSLYRISDVPIQKASDALVISLGLLMSMGSGVHLFFGGSHARLSL